MALKSFAVTAVLTEQPNGIPAILLQKKARPEWQRGFWNLPGGKIEGSELAHFAAARELREETAMDIYADMLTHRVKLYVLDGDYDVNTGMAAGRRLTHSVDFFSRWMHWEQMDQWYRSSRRQKAEAKNGEPTELFDIGTIPEETLWSVRELIGLLVDQRVQDTITITHTRPPAGWPYAAGPGFWEPK